MKQGIVIVGMPRSGTSLMARLLDRWGAVAGEADLLLAADRWNPHGYWEYQPIKRLNDALLASVGANERFPPDDEELLRARAQDPAFAEPAHRILEALGRGGRVWCVKDPRFRMLLPFWNAIWRDVCFIITVRHPLDSVRSLQQMVADVVGPEEYPASAVLLEWQHSLCAVLRHTQGEWPRCFLDYETLVQSPEQECARLLAFLDRHCAPPPARPSAAELAALIARDLHHQRGSGGQEARVMTAEQNGLYRFLRQQAAGPEQPFEPQRYPLYPGWREYLRVVDRLFQQRLTVQGEASSANLHDLLERREAELQTAPAGGR